VNVQTQTALQLERARSLRFEGQLADMCCSQQSQALDVTGLETSSQQSQQSQQDLHGAGKHVLRLKQDLDSVRESLQVANQEASQAMMRAATLQERLSLTQAEMQVFS
jgi:outer membrane murein-binding lipoprotein Lpp